MSIQIAKTAAEEVYADLDNLPDGFEDIRRAAAQTIAEKGLPNRRVEEWKWTDLRRIVDQAYPPVAGGMPDAAKLETLLAKAPFGALAGNTIVFINGVFNEERSNLPADISVTRIGETQRPAFARRDGDIVDALNLAYASDGVIIDVAAGQKPASPLALVFVTAPDQPGTVTTRCQINLAEGAELTVLETHTGHDDAYVANAAIEVNLADNATLHRMRLQEDGSKAVHLSNTIASLSEASKLRDFTFTLGGQNVRNQGFVDFGGENAALNMSGSYMLAGNQHTDTTLVINHAVPSCESRELYKCVMDENARGVFQGKVIVARDAQKTDGQQSANALLLAEGAEFDAKPELEIYADDVWCGHGATSGELDENQLFYLKARGIPEAKAKALLIAAFAAAAFEEIENEQVRDIFNDLAQGWLDRRGDK